MPLNYHCIYIYIHDTYIDIDVINFIDDDEPSVILAHDDCKPVNLSHLSSKAFGKSAC